VIIDGQEPGQEQLERVTPTTERTPTAHEESEGRETAWKVNIGLNSQERFGSKKKFTGKILRDR